MIARRHSPHRLEKGLSLVEISVVIGVMLGLATVVTYSISGILDWKTGRDATEKLRAVYIAQKGYLADRPSKNVSTFTAEDLIPYLPGHPGAMPTATTADGQALTLNLTVMPPHFTLGEARYDPSDSQNDGLWDVGTL